MKACVEFEGLILDRAAGEISPEDDARLEAHQAGCKACRAAERETRQALEFAALPAPTAAELAALDGVAQGVRAALRAAEHRRIWMRGALAGLVAAAAAAVLFLWPHKTPPAVQPTPAEEQASNAQPEEALIGSSGEELEIWAQSDPFADTFAEPIPARATPEEGETALLDPQTHVDLYLNPGE